MVAPQGLSLWGRAALPFGLNCFSSMVRGCIGGPGDDPICWTVLKAKLNALLPKIREEIVGPPDWVSQFPRHQSTQIKTDLGSRIVYLD